MPRGTLWGHMSELDPNTPRDESYDNFKLLESALTDPFVEQVYEKVRQYNEILSIESPSEEDKRAIFTDLDFEWGSIFDSKVQVSGLVRVYTAKGSDEEVKSIYVDNITAISKGFAVVDLNEYGGFSQDKSSMRAVHYMHFDPIDVWTPEENVSQSESQLVAGFVDLDESIIEFSGVSIDRAKNWLTVSCPTLVDDLDELLFQDNMHEDSIVGSLRDLNIQNNESLDDEFTRLCLKTYLNSSLPLDQRLPYVLSIQGKVLVRRDQNLFLTDVSGKGVLVYAHGFSISEETKTVLGDYALTLNAVVVPVDRESDPTYVDIPLNTVTSIQSIRSIYYE